MNTEASAGAGRPPSEIPPVPVEAQEVFGERLPLAERYAEALATDGVVRGLIGPREAPRLWERHVLNCAHLAPLVPHGASVCDVGSGAGLPGVVLAIARPDLRITLVEPLLRRTTFLSEVTQTLGLENVTVVRGRAEQVPLRHEFDVVTSRAVAALDQLLVWCMPLVAPTGAMVALKGSSATDEVAAAAPTLRRLGCATPAVVPLGPDGEAHRTCAVRVAWADPSQVGLPIASKPRTRRRR